MVTADEALALQLSLRRGGELSDVFIQGFRGVCQFDINSLHDYASQSTHNFPHDITLQLSSYWQGKIHPHPLKPFHQL